MYMGHAYTISMAASVGFDPTSRASKARSLPEQLAIVEGSAGFEPTFPESESGVLAIGRTAQANENFMSYRVDIAGADCHGSNGRPVAYKATALPLC